MRCIWGQRVPRSPDRLTRPIQTDDDGDSGNRRSRKSSPDPGGKQVFVEGIKDVARAQNHRDQANGRQGEYDSACDALSRTLLRSSFPDRPKLLLLFGPLPRDEISSIVQDRESG